MYLVAMWNARRGSSAKNPERYWGKLLYETKELQEVDGEMCFITLKRAERVARQLNSCKYDYADGYRYGVVEVPQEAIRK